MGNLTIEFMLPSLISKLPDQMCQVPSQQKILGQPGAVNLVAHRQFVAANGNWSYGAVNSLRPSDSYMRQ